MFGTEGSTNPMNAPESYISFHAFPVVLNFDFIYLKVKLRNSLNYKNQEKIFLTKQRPVEHDEMG